MPVRYFAGFCLVTGSLADVEITLVKFFAGKIEKNRSLAGLLELFLAVIFVVAFYLFAAHMYPDARLRLS